MDVRVGDCRVGISIPVGYTPGILESSRKLFVVKIKPAQFRLLRYLDYFGKLSVHTISNDLNMDSHSVRRCLEALRFEKFVQDEYVYFAPTVLPSTILLICLRLQIKVENT